jgi:hypothetical protein
MGFRGTSARQPALTPCTEDGTLDRRPVAAQHGRPGLLELVRDVADEKLASRVDQHERAPHLSRWSVRDAR